MKSKLTILYCTLISALLLGCDSTSSPFGEGGGASSGTNIISEKGFVIAFDETNPAVLDENGGHADVNVIVTINAADKLLLATSGATAYLDVDWGTLSSGSCTISNGSCSITWTSNGSFNPNIFPSDDAITFTGWVLGEESFSDVNGNTLFDDGDVFVNDTSGPFLDLDHTGTYSAINDKVLSPGNIGGVLTAADNLFNGSDCNHSSLCSPTSTQVYISSRAILSIRNVP